MPASGLIKTRHLEGLVVLSLLMNKVSDQLQIRNTLKKFKEKAKEKLMKEITKNWTVEKLKNSKLRKNKNFASKSIRKVSTWSA